jgi:ABC-type amino acid transport substrate-binding protein
MSLETVSQGPDGDQRRDADDGAESGWPMDDRVLTIGVDESPPPPLCYSLPDSPDFAGFEVDLMEAIARRLRLRLRWRSVYWRHAVEALTTGRLDAVCSAATITPQRLSEVDFSDPYLDSALILVTREIDPAPLDGELQGLVVGARVATVAEEYARAHCRAAAIKTFELNVSTYGALSRRLVDAVVDDEPIGGFFARTVTGLRAGAVLPGTCCQYGIMLARHRNDLRDALNDALAALRVDGTWQRLRRQWLEPASVRP